MKHTSEEMQLVINEWQASGLSKKAFCLRRNIKYQNFHYWCKRLGSVPAKGFTEMIVQGDAGGGRFEIIFPSGVRMAFQREPSANWLRELVR